MKTTIPAFKPLSLSVKLREGRKNRASRSSSSSVQESENHFLPHEELHLRTPMTKLRIHSPSKSIRNAITSTSKSLYSTIKSSVTPWLSGRTHARKEANRYSKDGERFLISSYRKVSHPGLDLEEPHQRKYHRYYGRLYSKIPFDDTDGFEQVARRRCLPNTPPPDALFVPVLLKDVKWQAQDSTVPLIVVTHENETVGDWYIPLNAMGQVTLTYPNPNTSGNNSSNNNGLKSMDNEVGFYYNGAVSDGALKSANTETTALNEEAVKTEVVATDEEVDAEDASEQTEGYGGSQLLGIDDQMPLLLKDNKIPMRLEGELHGYSSALSPKRMPAVRRKGKKSEVWRRDSLKFLRSVPNWAW